MIINADQPGFQLEMMISQEMWLLLVGLMGGRKEPTCKTAGITNYFNVE